MFNKCMLLTYFIDGVKCGINPIQNEQAHISSGYLLLYCAAEGHLMPLGKDFRQLD